MSIKYAPEVEQPDVPPLETKPQRSGGWFTRLQRRVKYALGGDDEALIIENKTEISWRIYHNYHWLGIIDARERQVFQLHKHGSLSVRPTSTTLLVSARAKGLDLVGLDEPEEHLAMDMRQRATRD